MNNDAMKNDLAELMALVQDQMRGLSEMQQKREVLTATVKTADGSVDVSVDARGIVTEIVIDESYLEAFELADLGGHITRAAREAAQEVAQRAAALLEPLTQRRGSIRGLSEAAVDLPELGDIMSYLDVARPPLTDASASGGVSEDGEQGLFPNVRQ
jgi:DNA-binding protein YbaB